jgi:HEAT repeat protein
MGDRRAFAPLARVIKALPPLTPDQERINRATPYLNLWPETPPFFPLAMADGRRAAPLLLARLDENQTELIRALGMTGSPRAVMPLIKKLEADPDLWVAYALVAIGNTRATPFFIRIINSHVASQQLTGNLLLPLGMLGGPGAAETLMNILDDPSESRIHWQAAGGMEALSDKASIPALKVAVKSRKGKSREEAIAALHRLQH